VSEPFLLKNGLARPAIDRIATAFKAVHPEFEVKQFARASMKGLDKLELKERVQHVICVLGEHLPRSFPETVKLLKRIPPVWDYGEPDDSTASFAAWPITDCVAEFGLDHPRLALGTLKKLTCMFSAEFAVRPFLLSDPDFVYETLASWCSDRSEHVRRLVSEGTRPRLPWSVQLNPAIADPSRGIVLLEKLKDDQSLYVRRSVANHLNDIAKDHPETCIAVCKRWNNGASEERKWIIRHATRTLVKAGHPDVFGLLGFTENPRLQASPIELNRQSLRLGGDITFAARLSNNNKRTQRVVIDYAIHHRKANGTTQPKVFKLKEATIAPGNGHVIKKRHAIKPISTRRYYSGKHAIELLVNGQPVAKATFDLKV